MYNGLQKGQGVVNLLFHTMQYKDTFQNLYF